jgi:hypothetical protein
MENMMMLGFFYNRETMAIPGGNVQYFPAVGSSQTKLEFKVY